MEEEDIIQTNNLDNKINETTNYPDIYLTRNTSNESLTSLNNNIDN